MMYKQWLIWLMYLSSYKIHNTTDNYKTKYFSVNQKVKSNSGKQPDVIRRFVAEKNEATGIYSFGDKKFVTMDDMLDHILGWQ